MKIKFFGTRFCPKIFFVAQEIDLNEARNLAVAYVRLRERRDSSVLVVSAGRAHKAGWSFSYTEEDGEILLGAPLIFVTMTRRIYEIGFPFDVEQFVATVLEGSRLNFGDQPPSYEIGDED